MAAVAFDEARAIIAAKMAEIGPRPESETVPLRKAPGRVLAVAVRADRDYPPFNRSARDGFAVRASDLREVPATLRLIGETRAGEPSRFRIQPGETVAIMTGAPGPEGADAVVMVEHSSREGQSVTFHESIPSGRNLIFKGSEGRAGSIVLEPGVRLAYHRIALLASAGVASISVYRQPRVAILSTGDEVLEVNARPESYQIRNSNAYSLAAQVEREGGVPWILPVAPDDLGRTRELIQQGLGADMLLLSGGVSAGKYDYVEQVLGDLGAEIHLTQVAIQPGKPLVFATIGPKPVFGLPGNPISTMVTFRVFAAMALHRLTGRADSPLPFARVRLGCDFKHKPVLTRFLPAVLEGSYGEARVNPVKWQGSGDLIAVASANCYLVAAAGRESWKAGEWIAVVPM